LISLAPDLDRLIEAGGVNALVQLLPHHPDHVEQLPDILAFQGADGSNRCKIENREQESDSVLDRLQLIADSCKQIDLVQYQNDSLSTAYYKIGNLLVLIGKSFDAVDHQQNNIGFINRLDCTVDRVILDILLNLALAPDACGIEYGKVGSLVVEGSHHHITGGTGNVTDD